MGLRDNIIKGIAGWFPELQAPLPRSHYGSQSGPEIVKAVPTNQPLPRPWAETTFAPGWPIQPLTPPQDEGLPREIDYAVAANINIVPRSSYGLMSFAALREAYENITEVKMAVNTLVREMVAFDPQLVNIQGGSVADDHPYNWLTMFPDGQTAWDVWLTRFLTSVLVFDAGAIYIQRDPLTRHLKGLSYVDGSTLFVLVDQLGRLPVYPDPAFSQIIKGVPFGWYTQDDIWYRPRFRRYNAPYGTSPIEMCWGWILIISNITASELSYWREGNMPEGVGITPDTWTLDQTEAFEAGWNSRMAATHVERRRMRFLPFGSDVKTVKKQDFPKELYERAFHNILLSYGLPPSEFGDLQQRGGLGGKGFMEAMQTSLYRMGIAPLKSYVEGLFNDILKRFDIRDVRFVLNFPAESVNPDVKQGRVINQFTNALLSFNQAQEQLGQPRVAGGDIHVLKAGNQVIVLEDYFRGLRPMQQPGGEGDAKPVAGKPGTSGSDSGSGEQFKPSGTKPDVATPQGGEKPDTSASTPSKTQPTEFGTTTPKYVLTDSKLSMLGGHSGKILCKHCGVCSEDDEYYGAPVTHMASIEMPVVGANDPEIVSIGYSDQAARPAVWKPEGNELEVLQDAIGGKQYPREEAAYLVDRALDYYLVPMAYVTEVANERGAALSYVRGAGKFKDPEEYNQDWIVKAGVLDYLLGNLDRHTGNWLTHPDNPNRPILIDNGMSLPTKSGGNVHSPFTELVMQRALPSDILDSLDSLDHLLAKYAYREKLIALVGEEAVNQLQVRLHSVLKSGEIPGNTWGSATQSTGSVSAETSDMVDESTPETI